MRRSFLVGCGAALAALAFAGPAALAQQGEFKIGDVVRIQECRPLSKLKTWEVLERVGK